MSASQAPGAVHGRAPLPPEADAADYPATRWVAMAVLLIAGFMNLMDVTIVNVALPTMQRAFGADAAQMEWVIAAYSLAFAIGLLPFGRLGDRYGRPRLFLIGVVLFTIFSALCGLAPDMTTLIVARAAQGLSAAMMTPQTLAIAQVIFPPRERGFAFALFGLTASLAAVSGPITGGLLIAADFGGLDWRPIFLVNIPVGVLAVLAALRFIPPMPGNRETGVDLVGITLAGLAVFLLVFPLIEGRGFGWPTWCFVMMAAAVPAAVAFVLWQYRQEARRAPQVLPPTLLRNPNYMLGSLAGAVFFSATPGFFMCMAIFLQGGFGLTPLQSGLTTLPFSLGVMASSLVSGWLGRSSLRARMLAGAMMMLVAMLWLREVIAGVGDVLDPWRFLPPLLLAGFGMGTTIAPLFQTVLAGIEGRDAGSASGALQAVQQAGAALGVAIIGELFFRRLADDMPGAITLAGNAHPAFVDALRHAIWYQVAAYAVVALLVVVALRRPPGAAPAEARQPVPVEA